MCSPHGDLLCHPAVTADTAQIAALLRTAFTPETTTGWSAHALADFYRRHQPDAIDIAISTAAYHQICVAGARVLGYIIFSKPSYLTLLAVSPDHQGRGIGRRLLQEAFRFIDTSHHGQVSMIEVSATPWSAPFYRKHGFYPVSPFMLSAERRFVRMAFWRGQQFFAPDVMDTLPDASGR